MDLEEFEQLSPHHPIIAALGGERPIWRGVALAALNHPQQNLDVDCAPFVQDEYGNWQVSRWIGTFKLGTETYRVKPRIGVARFNIIAVSVLFASVIKRRGGSTSAEHGELIEFLPLVWYIAFRAGVLRHGLPKTYVRREARDCSELRGSLDLKRQLLENDLERQQFACSWDDLTVDNPINRATQLVISHVRKHGRFPYAGRVDGPRRDLDGWRERLPLMGVSIAPQFPSERINWSRANDGFRAAHGLARRVTQNRGFEAGDRRLHEAIFVDSAEVWELYLRERLRSVVGAYFPGFRVDWPRSSKVGCLLLWEGRPVRGLIPDFSIIQETNGRVAVILDAKYRYYRPPTEDHDSATQMALYIATAGQGENAILPTCVLIYPRTEDFNGNVRVGRLGDGRFRMRDEPRLLTWAIELGNPDNRARFHADVDQQLKELLVECGLQSA